MNVHFLLRTFPASKKMESWIVSFITARLPSLTSKYISNNQNQIIYGQLREIFCWHIKCTIKESVPKAKPENMKQKHVVAHELDNLFLIKDLRSKT